MSERHDCDSSVHFTSETVWIYATYVVILTCVGPAVRFLHSDSCCMDAREYCMAIIEHALVALLS